MPRSLTANYLVQRNLFVGEIKISVITTGNDWEKSTKGQFWFKIQVTVCMNHWIFSVSLPIYVTQLVLHLLLIYVTQLVLHLLLIYVTQLVLRIPSHLCHTTNNLYPSPSMSHNLNSYLHCTLICRAHILLF